MYTNIPLYSRQTSATISIWPSSISHYSRKQSVIKICIHNFSLPLTTSHASHTQQKPKEAQPNSPSPESSVSDQPYAKDKKKTEQQQQQQKN